jgi:glucose/arabinose dehydrogenase
MIKQCWTLALASAALAAATLTAVAQNPPHPAGASGDWRADAPGAMHHITAADLPAPFASPSVRSRSSVVARPAGAQLKVPPGFEIKQIAQGLEKPRLMRLAPNGDIFVSETGPGRVRVLRLNADNSGVAQNEVFAAGLNLPFGISFYPPDNPQWVYVAQTDKVVRFPYAAGDLKARGGAEVVVAELPHGGNHYSRDVVFSADGKIMFVSVGSGSNVAEGMGTLDPAALATWIKDKPLGATWGNETERADVLAFDPDGKNRRIYATGIRNCVGMAINPTTGDLWCSTNERDLLGDNLVPDYLTRVRAGAFYGWPWYYIGAHQDPRHPGARGDLKDKVTIPDVLIQAHSASLQMMFYTGDAFPADYKGSAFAAQHGSWNRATRTGYKIIRAPMKNGVATGDYEDFVTGFVVSDSDVWGRPVGVVQAKDGSLILSEDGNGTIWRATHKDRASAR